MDRPLDALPEGTKLAGYVIGRVLGRGGFGVTYFATDALFPDTKVAIKEFLPSGLALRKSGAHSVHPTSPDRATAYARALASFEKEARTLVSLRHPNVVEAQRYIEANGTAYVVMRFEDGASLSELVANGGTLDEAEIMDFLPPLLDGLEAVHARKFVHRDIKPGNIYLRRADGSPVLLDFGAAREAIGEERKTSLSEIYTPGYAPLEQYDRHAEQGPFTDIYALGATLYRCMTGETPPEAITRHNALRRKSADPLVPVEKAAPGRFSPALCEAVRRSLMLEEADRPQSIAELRGLLPVESLAKTSDVSRGPEPTLVGATPDPVSRPPRHETVPPAEPPPAPRRRTLAYAAVAAILLATGGAAAFMIAGEDTNRNAGIHATDDPSRRAAAEAERKAEADRKAEAERRAREEEARRKADDEAQRKAEADKRAREEEDRRRAEEERRRADEAAKRRADEEARRKSEQEESQRRAEEEAKRKSDEEAQRKAEADRRAREERAREDEERRRAAEDERRRADQEARRRAEEEAMRKADEDFKAALKSGDWAAAQRSIDEIRRLQPNYPQIADFKGLLLAMARAERAIKDGDWEEAEKVLTSAEKIYPTSIQLAELRRQLKAGRDASAALKPGRVFRDCPECPEMVVIPSGSFMMGAADEEKNRDTNELPQHRVTIATNFALGKFEVTRGEFATFVRETGYASQGCLVISETTIEKKDWETGREQRSWREPGFPQSDRHPVTCVDWDDAKAYVTWLSRKTGKIYRLPTESEWEYAARAGTTTRLYWGDDPEFRDACTYANGADESLKPLNLQVMFMPCNDRHLYTAPVGSFVANRFGLHDMSGNVYEWVEDCSSSSYAGATGNGRARTLEDGECRYRVIRGGAWPNDRRELRSAMRGGDTRRTNYYGFRVARSP